MVHSPESICPHCSIQFPVPRGTRVYCAHGGGVTDREIVTTMAVPQDQQSMDIEPNITHTREDF